MADDLEAGIELRVFILQCIEAVGAGRQQFVELDGFEGFNVLFRHDLVDIFMPQAAGGFSAAAFSIAQNGEIDTGLVQQLDKRLAGVLVVTAILYIKVFYGRRRAARRSSHPA